MPQPPALHHRWLTAHTHTHTQGCSSSGGSMVLDRVVLLEAPDEVHTHTHAHAHNSTRAHTRKHMHTRARAHPHTRMLNTTGLESPRARSAHGPCHWLHLQPRDHATTRGCSKCVRVCVRVCVCVCVCVRVRVKRISTDNPMAFRQQNKSPTTTTNTVSSRPRPRSDRRRHQQHQSSTYHCSASRIQRLRNHKMEFQYPEDSK